MRKWNRHRVLDGVQQLDHHVGHVPERELPPIGRPQRRANPQRVQHQGLRHCGGPGGCGGRGEVVTNIHNDDDDDEAWHMERAGVCFRLWFDMEEDFDDDDDDGDATEWDYRQDEQHSRQRRRRPRQRRW